MIAWIISNFGGWIVAGVSALAVLIGIYFKGKGDGKADERLKAIEERQRARDIADEIDQDIGLLTPEQQREALKRWDRR